jgi:hypothetical protein
MKDVDQTHPHTNRAFGFAVYEREAIADGGREQDDQTMRDVEHGEPSESEGPRRTFERGSGVRNSEPSGRDVRGESDE